MLAETRCVKRAAEAVGMSRESAYRLRKRRGAGSFCAAWDAILGPPGTPRPKVTLDPLFQRLAHGTVRPVMRGGRYAGTLQKPDLAALRSALSNADRTLARRAARRKGHGNQKPRSA